MKITKGNAYFITTAAIVFVYLVAMRDQLINTVEIFKATLFALVAVATAYIGGNVADNGVKGKFYRPEMDKELSRPPEGY